MTPGGEASLPGLPVVWDTDCLLHGPEGEVWLGVWDAGTEVPERATALLDAVRCAGAEVVAAARHDDSVILAVHDGPLIEHLSTVWHDWEAAGYPSEHDRGRVRIGALEPAVVVQEGGYDLAVLGQLAVAFLSGLHEIPAP